MEQSNRHPDDDGFVLKDEDREKFEQLAMAANVDDHGVFVRDVEQAEKEAASDAPSQATISRRTRTGLIAATAVLGAATVAAGVAAVVEYQNATMPTTGEVRAAAFKDPTSLLLTGTCTEELEAETARLALLPTAVRAHDTQHPSLEAYREAVQTAKMYDVPCEPIGSADPISLVTVRGHSFTVSGGMTVTVVPEATSLLDQGTDVADVCDGVGLAVDSRDPALAAQVTKLRQTAQPYCTESGPAMSGTPLFNGDVTPAPTYINGSIAGK